LNDLGSWGDRLMKLMIDGGLRSLHESGSRIVRAQALIFAIHAVRAVRAILLLNYLIQFSVFVTALGFSAGAYALVEQLLRGEGIEPTPLLVMGWGSFALFGGVLLLTTSQRLWLRALGLDELIRQVSEGSAVGDSPGAGPDSGARTLSQGDLDAMAEMIDRAVERKLRQGSGKNPGKNSDLKDTA
jgi:hypothetical protein